MDTGHVVLADTTRTATTLLFALFVKLNGRNSGPVAPTTARKISISSDMTLSVVTANIPKVGSTR